MEHKIQIPEANFSKSFRGYDVSDVNFYLAQVENFVEQNKHLQEGLEDKISTLELEIARLREVENSLFRALKMAEEAQQNWLNKMDSEVNQLIDNAKEKANKIIEDAQKEAQKVQLLAENERKLILEEANKKSIETNRSLMALQAAQKEVAKQLIQISELTLEKVKSWEDLSVESSEKTKHNDSIPLETLKSPEKKKVVLVKKDSKNAKTPDKKEKVLVKNPKNELKTPSKSPIEPKKKSIVPKQELMEDDSLPTLNKVLEAYAKSNGPKGKIGEIN
ncbi:DivIVA domain-containing protein [Aquirufa sp. ROCK-SH2]